MEQPIVNKFWDYRRKFRERANNLEAESNKLFAESEKLKLEIIRLREEGCNLRAEGNKIWREALIETYGDMKIEWKNFDPQKQDYECHLENGEVFKP